MQMTEIPAIITQALAVIPANVRDGFSGAAYLKLQEVADKSEPEQLAAIRSHVRYLWRRDRRSKTADPANMPDPADDTRAIVLRDEIMGLDPQDAVIVTMILAGHTRRQIATATQSSPATIGRRIARLRGMMHAH